MVERAPRQHLEGISVNARRDMVERTVQVNTNDNNLSSIKWNYSETREHRNAFALYTICSENVSLCIYFNLKRKQGMLNFVVFS